MSQWNLADVWEAVAETHPGLPVLAQGPTLRSWQEFNRRADAVAAALVAAGLAQQAKVAQYLYNGPEYLESLFASFKAGLVPVNTNYRYTADELVYLWDNADVEAVVLHGALVPIAEDVRSRLPAIRLWLWADDGSGPCPDWATPYEAVAATEAPDGPFRAPWGRSPDDLILVYTGGTTGMPKGVMWRQDDLFGVLNQTGEIRYPDDGGVDDVRRILSAPFKHPPARLLPGPPLMHGTSLFSAMSVLNSAGSVVILPGRHFDVEALLDTVQSERITELCIVGDAFAKPILAALDAEPDRWDLSSLWLIVSSGVIWSAEVKAGLLRHQPRLLMIDSLGSSEAVGMARSKSSRDGTASTAGFRLGPDTQVLGEDGTPVRPGSGEPGLLALRGRGPIGYYKDPDKSAGTFRIIAGERWTVPGDFATVGVDGALQLLGRGSMCINTGGEKVFPEEVEESLKLYPPVADAVVVGIPDDRFGEAVAALVEWRPGLAEDDPDQLIAFARGRLAGYKVPRRILTIDTVGRAPNGKVDYRRLRQYAVDALAGVSSRPSPS